MPIPRWLNTEDVLHTLHATFLRLGYQRAAEMEISVVVESSTSDKFPKKTRVKWAILANPDSGFKYTDCMENPRPGRVYRKDEKDIADEEIVAQLASWIPHQNMGTTAVLISGDFKVLNECRALRKNNINVIVVVRSKVGLKIGVLEELVDLGVTIISDWEWFLMYPDYCTPFTASEKPRTEDGDGDGAASAMKPVQLIC